MLTFSSAVPVLRVADVARSLAWYRDILGFDAPSAPGADAATEPAAAPEPTASPVTSRTLRRDRTELVLRQVAAPAPAARGNGDWDVYLRLTGGALVELLDHARRRTPLVRGPELMPSGHVEFELEDPDGHRICLAEALTDTKGIPRAVS